MAHVLTLDAAVFCPHGGVAHPVLPNPRVLLGGKPAAAPGTLVVQGCPGDPVALNASTGGSVPVTLMACFSGSVLGGSTRVTSNGAPLVLQDSQMVSVPTARPLFCAQPGQLRVRAK